jgi:hypothetical protein
MEKLEESEIKKKLSIKTGLVAVSLSVSCVIMSTHCYLRFLIICFHPLMVLWSLSLSFQGWLSVVWMYLQAGQSFIQQVPPLHIMDPHNVCIKDICWYLCLYAFYFILFSLVKSYYRWRMLMELNEWSAEYWFCNLV